MTVEGGRPGRRVWVEGLLAAAAGALLFLLLGGWPLLDADAPLWLRPPDSLAAPALVSRELMERGWRFPLAGSFVLSAPDGISAARLGGAPWAALALKALGARGAAPLGWALLLAFAGQGGGAWSLLRAAGVRRPEVLGAGVALSLAYPSWLVSAGHAPAAAGHGLLLLTLALAVGTVRSGLSPRRALLFAALLAACAGWDASLLAPAVAAWAATLAGAALRGAGRLALGAALRGGLALGVAAFALGYDLDRAPRSTLQEGRGLPALAGVFWPRGGVPFLQQVGPGDHERYVYAGLGLLALLSMAAILLRGRALGSWGDLRRWAPLGGAAAGLWLSGLAGGPAAMGWAGTYLALAWALAALERTAPARRVLLLAAATALQWADSASLLVQLRSRWTQPPPVSAEALRGVNGRSFQLIPKWACLRSAEPRDVLAASVRIVRDGGAAPALPRPDQKASCTPARNFARTADDLSDTLVVAAGAGSAFVSHRDDCYELAGARLCGARLDRSGLRHVAPVAPAAGRRSLLDADLDPRNAASAQVLADGWSTPEAGGVWSDGRRAMLRLPVPSAAPAAGVRVGLELYAFAPGRKVATVKVLADGRPVATLAVSAAGYAPYTVAVPADRLAPLRPLVLTLELPDAATPKEAGLGTDTRRLGVALRRITVSHTSEEDAAAGTVPLLERADGHGERHPSRNARAAPGG